MAWAASDGSSAAAARSGLLGLIDAAAGDAYAEALHLFVLIPGLAGLVGVVATIVFIRNRPAHR